MDKQGRLIVVSGFSGVGKGTIVKELLRRYPTQYALSISATTRLPRESEEDGREYFFISKPEFEERILNGGFFEHTVYSGNYYGTPRSYVEEQLERGKDVILEIEVDGGLQIKKQFPEVFLVFVIPPCAETLIKRLRGRGTETEAEIRQRICRAMEECAFIERYDEVLVNDGLDLAVESLHRMIKENAASGIDKRMIAEKLHDDIQLLSKEN